MVDKSESDMLRPDLACNVVIIKTFRHVDAAGDGAVLQFGLHLRFTDNAPVLADVVPCRGGYRSTVL